LATTFCHFWVFGMSPRRWWPIATALPGGSASECPRLRLLPQKFLYLPHDLGDAEFLLEDVLDELLRG
jgi:hypothetical protein